MRHAPFTVMGGDGAAWAGAQHDSHITRHAWWAQYSYGALVLHMPIIRTVEFIRLVTGFRSLELKTVAQVWVQHAGLGWTAYSLPDQVTGTPGGMQYE